MQKNHVRYSARRVSETRRVQDRRIIPYPFGSLEWVENIKSNYLAWPKFDRRETERRSSDRREHDRRQKILTEQLLSLQKYSATLLTHEELKLIDELYKCDME